MLSIGGYMTYRIRCFPQQHAVSAGHKETEVENVSGAEKETTAKESVEYYKGR
jgi:hypothetical protein